MNQENAADVERVIKKEYSNIAGIVIMKDDISCYEQYFNDCNSDTPIHVSSVTKSVISLLIGIAIDEGFIESVDQKVLDFFPDYVVKRGERTIQQVTLKDLLTMTAPYKYRSTPYVRYFSSDDNVRFSLDTLGGKGEIGEFRYAPIVGPDIVSGILAKATNDSVLEFARRHVFSPLGISVESDLKIDSKDDLLTFYRARNLSGWIAGPTGVNTAGWGLTLTAMDMAKLGQLYLDEGAWNGERIVSQAWIGQSLREQSVWREPGLSYGYLWWVGIGGGYAAMGDSGNVIYVNPSKRLVVSISSLFKPSAGDRIELIQRYIEPIFD